MATWRDRLYHSFRIPTILAALNDVKTPYVEILSPFLSRPIIMAARALPDRLRTDKLLFKRIVRSMGPRIPFAKRSATWQIGDILKLPDAQEAVFDELSSLHARQLFGRGFCDYVLDVASPAVSTGRRGFRGIANEPDCFALAVGAEEDEKLELRRLEILMLKSLAKVRAFIAQAESGEKPTILELGPDKDDKGRIIH